MKKIAIIGGGFAGSFAAGKLEKNFEVTLIDTKNYFEFTPGVLRTIVEPEYIKKLQVMHEQYLKRANVIVGRVKEVSKNFVKVNGKNIRFDYLIISSGSFYHTPFKDQKVVITTRAEKLRKHYRDLFNAKKVLIIGGGPVGVELAGEILWKYGNEKEITIVHSKEKLLERNSDRAIKYAENYLKNRGVKTICNEKVVEIKPKFCLTDKKTIVGYDIAFLCTGITPHFKFMKRYFSDKLNERNQIKVNEYLQVEGEKNIFSAGDVNNIAQEKTAQNAEAQAKTVVQNILALENKKNMRIFESKITSQVISLGKNYGIYTNGRITVGGFFPGKLKGFIEWKEMAEKRNS